MKRSCTAEEFEAFLKGYPRPLERDVARTHEPPLVTYNDFTRGGYPVSVVASHSFDNLAGTVPSDWKIESRPGERL